MDRPTRVLFLLVLAGLIALTGAAAMLLGGTSVREPDGPPGAQSMVGAMRPASTNRKSTRVRRSMGPAQPAAGSGVAPVVGSAVVTGRPTPVPVLPGAWSGVPSVHRGQVAVPGS